jgi:hypothetical protein
MTHEASVGVGVGESWWQGEFFAKHPKIADKNFKVTRGCGWHDEIYDERAASSIVHSCSMQHDGEENDALNPEPSARPPRDLAFRTHESAAAAACERSMFDFSHAALASSFVYTCSEVFLPRARQ